MKGKRKMIHPSGFTLIELMVVVAILSIIASVAIPSFQKYIKKSKNTEAYTNLRKIYDGEVVYYQQEVVDSSGNPLPKRFVQTSIEPSWPPTSDKRIGNFTSENWNLLQFTTDSPTYYVYFTDAYPFVSNYPYRPPQFDITADPPNDVIAGMMVNVVGDTDGDGTFSYFMRSMGIENGGKENAMPGVYALDPLE